MKVKPIVRSTHLKRHKGMPLKVSRSTQRTDVSVTIVTIVHGKRGFHLASQGVLGFAPAQT